MQLLSIVLVSLVVAVLSIALARLGLSLTLSIASGGRESGAGSRGQ